MIKFTTILTEIKLNDLTNQIVKDIFFKLNHINSDKKYKKPQLLISSSYEIPLVFNLNVYLQIDAMMKKTYNLDAYTDIASSIIQSYDLDDEITIIIQLNNIIDKSFYTQLAADLKDYTRHELEHLTQSYNELNRHRNRPKQTIKQRDKINNTNRYKYYLLPDEIPAMVAGLYKKAKYLKKPINIVFKEYLDSRELIDNLTNANKELILSKWIEYTKKHYTSAKFSNDTLSEGIIDPNVNFIVKILNDNKSQLFNKQLSSIEIGDSLTQLMKHEGIMFLPDSDLSNQSDLESYKQIGLMRGTTLANQIIIIFYNPDEFYKTFEDDDLYKLFIKVLYQLIQHEMIHVKQLERISNNVNTSSEAFNKLMQKLNTDPHDVQSYLSKPHELMAYAHDAVSEFINAGYPIDKILNRVKMPYNTSIAPHQQESDIFYLYTDWFDSRSITLKRFLNYMYKYLINEQQKSSN